MKNLGLKPRASGMAPHFVHTSLLVTSLLWPWTCPRPTLPGCFTPEKMSATEHVVATRVDCCCNTGRYVWKSPRSAQLTLTRSVPVISRKPWALLKQRSSKSTEEGKAGFQLSCPFQGLTCGLRVGLHPAPPCPHRPRCGHSPVAGQGRRHWQPKDRDLVSSCWFVVAQRFQGIFTISFKFKNPFSLPALSLPHKVLVSVVQGPPGCKSTSSPLCLSARIPLHS